MKIFAIAGARPNFVKIAALEHAFRSFPQCNFNIVHTGQHYTPALDSIFFEQLDIPQPGFQLGTGLARQHFQLIFMFKKIEEIFLAEEPDLIITVGDTTSTLAGALAAARTRIPLAHVEAGLRSFDRSMPEENNRIATDALSDYLFVTEQAGADNLEQEGVESGKIFDTGNCMIDTLVRFEAKADALHTCTDMGLRAKNYVLATLHRPSNVDSMPELGAILRMLEYISREVPVIFPAHPRTVKQMEAFGFTRKNMNLENVHMIGPQGYLEFLSLLKNAALVMTDSGGIQEETTYLGVPCLTLRTTTERPVTVLSGTNELFPSFDPDLAMEKVRKALGGNWKTGIRPPLWDGQSGRRIAGILAKKLTHFR